jgi:hypothetical protein
VKKVALVILAVALGALLASEMPAIVRYLKIERM